jgi:predicted dehydrogenase
VDTEKKRAPERHGAAANSTLVRAIGDKDFPDAARYRDFRQLLEKEKNIDAVIVGTPDHTHAAIAMAAIQMSKHVHCEKPLARTVYEIRKLSEAARQQRVATQLSNQGHSFLACREFCEAIRSDVIGDVTGVHAVVRFGGGDPDRRIAQLNQQPEVPETLDWNLWRGPAPTRNFHPTYHTGGWPGWRKFGSGVLGDYLCHLVDPVFWALRLDAPTSIVAEAKGYDPKEHSEVFPRSAKIRYEFPARGTRKPVTLYWYDGDLPDLGIDETHTGVIAS